MGIRKIQYFTFSIDLRSVMTSQRSLEMYFELSKYTQNKNHLHYWVYLPSIIQYNPPDDVEITELFVPKKERLIFDAKDPVIKKVKETDINSVIKLNIFTDLVGIQEDQPNGLVQAEGTFTTHLLGIGSRKIKYKLNKIYYLEHMEANLKFSKIENKLRYLDAGIIKGGSTVTFVPNFQLLQYSNLEAGIKVSAMKIESYKQWCLNLYRGIGVLRTGIRDTNYSVNTSNDTTKIPRTYNLLTLKKSLQAHLKIKATSYMGIDVSAEFIWLTLMDNEVKQSGGDFSREANHYEQFNAKQNVLISPQFQVYYLPNKNESQRLYLRSAFLHDLGTKSNGFLTIQVGFSSDINKFLNFNKQ